MKPSSVASYVIYINYPPIYFPPHGTRASSVPGPPHYRGFTITLRHITLSRIPLDEWSAQQRDFYLTTHNIKKRHTFAPLARFKPATPASKKPQTQSQPVRLLGSPANITQVLLDTSQVIHVNNIRRLFKNIRHRIFIQKLPIVPKQQPCWIFGNNFWCIYWRSAWQIDSIKSVMLYNVLCFLLHPTVEQPAIACCTLLQHSANDAVFLPSIITGNETWVYS
jgi:hypothetical protein